MNALGSNEFPLANLSESDKRELVKSCGGSDRQQLPADGIYDFIKGWIDIFPDNPAFDEYLDREGRRVCASLDTTLSSGMGAFLKSARFIQAAAHRLTGHGLYFDKEVLANPNYLDNRPWEIQAEQIYTNNHHLKELMLHALPALTVERDALSRAALLGGATVILAVRQSQAKLITTVIAEQEQIGDLPNLQEQYARLASFYLPDQTS